MEFVFFNKIVDEPNNIYSFYECKKYYNKMINFGFKNIQLFFLLIFINDWVTANIDSDSSQLKFVFIVSILLTLTNFYSHTTHKFN